MASITKQNASFHPYELCGLDAWAEWINELAPLGSFLTGEDPCLEIRATRLDYRAAFREQSAILRATTNLNGGTAAQGSEKHDAQKTVV
jgi:hypothetical protein